MNRTFRHIFPLFVSLLVVAPPYVSTEGCGIDYHPESYRMALFNPRVIDRIPLAPFHYSHNLLHSGEADGEQRDYRRNCGEWVAYLGPEVREKDVMSIIYSVSPDRFLEAYESGPLAERFRGNTFIEQLTRPGREKALEYLIFAKRNEFIHFAGDDPWELGESLQDKQAALAGQVRQASARLEERPDPFLRERYAYQLVVNRRYLGEYQDCIDTYDRYFGEDNGRSTILSPWGMLHKAHALAQLGDTIRSNYLLSLVFDRCESKKIRSYHGFERDKAEDALRYARNDHEKAVLLTMKELRNPGRSLEGLQQIAALDPESAYLPLLLTREINKLEDWLLTPGVTFFEYLDEGMWEDYDRRLPREEIALRRDTLYTAANFKKDMQYLRGFRSFLEALPAASRRAHGDFLHLALAHLHQLDRQPAPALEHLAGVSKQAPAAMQLQKHIGQLLLLPQQRDINEPAVREELARSFEYLRANIRLLDPKLNLYPKLLLYFSRLFHRQGDIVAAGLLYNRSAVPVNAYPGTPYYMPIAYFDRHATPADIDRLLELAEKPGKTTFESFLTAPLNEAEQPAKTPDLYDDKRYYIEDYQKELGPGFPMPGRRQLLDLKGTLAFRKNDLTTAMSAFEQLPDDYWSTTYEFKNYLNTNPFGDSKSLPWLHTGSWTINKKEVVRRMMELERSGTTEDAYLLANAYYNSTWWGNSWMLFSYGKSISEISFFNRFDLTNFSFYPNADTYFDVYYGLRRAAAQYQKVLDSEPGTELAARAAYMLARCDLYRRRAEWERTSQSYEDEMPSFYSPLFTDWQRRYRKTDTYRLTNLYCPELEDFIQKNKK